MIRRDATASVKKFAKVYPVISILGPRQSGKTTLAKLVFNKYRYVNFEDFRLRAYAETDPYKFLDEYSDGPGVIFDEIQHVPSLLSYIQIYSDQHERPGFFILTGSQNFLLSETISQSLAGRMAIVTLLPLSINELKDKERSLDTLILNGGYPRIYAQDVSPLTWYPFYIQQYVERDVRQMINIHNLNDFQRFIRLCAGRVGQLLNLASLASDCGISSPTAKAWLSLLEASYIIFLLQPYNKNFNRRFIKSPKIFFNDTGILCSLLGIQNEEQLSSHYAYGNIFESLVISEIRKEYYNRGAFPHLYFWQTSSGKEVDCIVESGTRLIPIEVKAGRTINTEYFEGLTYWYDLVKMDPSTGFIIYGGTENQTRSKGKVLGWTSIPTLLNLIEQKS